MNLKFYSNVLEEQFWWKSLNKTTQEDYLEFILGKKERYNTTALKSLTFYYLMIIFVGVIGNVLTAWVITISSALQTPSNYFLCNLAVIDLITLLLGKQYFHVLTLNIQFFSIICITFRNVNFSFSFVKFHFKSFQWKSY